MWVGIGYNQVGFMSHTFIVSNVLGNLVTRMVEWTKMGPDAKFAPASFVI